MTTNLDTKEISKRYGDRIADRLNETMAKIVYRNPTYRMDEIQTDGMRRIEAHICICFIAYKVYKELEGLIAINKIGMSVDHVLDVAKTITTIKIRMPENGAFFTKTLFLTDKHRTIMSLFDLSKDKF